MSKESDAVTRWKTDFSPEERAIQYWVMAGLLLEPSDGSYEGLEEAIPALRYGLHSDIEAKEYINDNPEIFGPFKLDFYHILDTAIQQNYVQTEYTGEIEPEYQGMLSQPVTEQMEARNTAINPMVDDEYLVPIGRLRMDLRPYMPYEERLGMNIWPMVGAVTALTAGRILLPMVGISLSGMALASIARVAAGLSLVTKYVPPRTTLDGSRTMYGQAVWYAGHGSRVAAAGAAATTAVTVWWHYNDPEDAGKHHDESVEGADKQYASNAAQSAVDSIPDQSFEDFAERGNVVVSGEATSDSVMPTEQSQAYAEEAAVELNTSARYPQDLIEASVSTSGPEVHQISAQESGMNSLAGTGLGSIFSQSESSTGGSMTQSAQDYEDDAVAWMQEHRPELWDHYVQKYGEAEAIGQAVAMYRPNLAESTEPEPTPWIGQGVQGSPIQRPDFDQSTGQWGSPTYKTERQNVPGYFPDEMQIPWAPRYNENHFSNVIGNMTPGQVESFVEQGIMAGVIPETYIGSGLMDGVITSAMQGVMYQANLAGSTWDEILGKMVTAFQAAKAAAKEDRLNEWYNNFVPSSPYFDLDPDTISQRVKGTMRNILGREANQWEIDMMADGMRTDHRTSYDRQIAAEQDVWNTRGRAEEYDAPQSLPTDYEAVDEEAGFAERFEERYDTEIGQMERQERMESDSKNLFGSLTQLSRMGGGV